MELKSMPVTALEAATGVPFIPRLPDPLHLRQYPAHHPR
jgi:hypothetical protein